MLFKKIEAKSIVKCSNCKKEFLAHQSRINYYDNLFCSKKCYLKSGNFLGTQNFQTKEKWKKIRSKLASNVKYLEWRKKVLEKDSYQCQKCGTKEKLRVHHLNTLLNISKKYNPKFKIDDELIQKTINSKEFKDVNNGQTLCISCHLKAHK